MGNLQKAEDTYTKVIKLAPDHYEAWYNRSTLRKQTPDNNHVRELEKKPETRTCATRWRRSMRISGKTNAVFPV